MKKILFTITMIIAANAAFAQIPNAGFETWINVDGYNMPDKWDNLNVIGANQNIYVCTQGMPGNTGNSYVKLVSKTVGSKVVPGVLATGIVTVDTSNMGDVTVYHGFPFRDRPDALTGSWQYMAYGTDMGYAQVYFTKWNTANSRRDTVGSAHQTLSGMEMSWVTFSIPMAYSKTDFPDTAMLIFSASSMAPVENSYLYLDNLAFTGGTSGVATIGTSVNNVSVYPNPATNAITVDLQNVVAATSVSMIDVKGAVVKTIDIIKGQNKCTISTALIAKGVYFLKLNDANGTTSKKVVVQ